MKEKEPMFSKEEMEEYRKYIESMKDERMITFRDPEGGLHTLPESQFKKLKPKAPIIADGKTLDELVEGDLGWQKMVQAGRAAGATDEEIWDRL